MTGEVIGGAITGIGTFASSSAGSALIAGVGSAAAGAGLNAALAHKGGITIPPPPGAAMIDPAGASAAASIRQRQATAGGLQSTITGAGAPPSGGPTSGAKGLLGQ